MTSHTHTCERLSPSELPYRYRCTQCNQRLKILSGILGPAQPSKPAEGVSATVALRMRHPFAPWDLATVREGGAVIEVTSHPWEENGDVWVMARTTIGDATTLHTFRTSELAVWDERLGDMRSYRLGFLQGWACAVAEARKLRKEAN